MTADRNQAGYTDASGAHGAGLVVMWVRRGRPDRIPPALGSHAPHLLLPFPSFGAFGLGESGETVAFSELGVGSGLAFGPVCLGRGPAFERTVGRSVLYTHMNSASCPFRSSRLVALGCLPSRFLRVRWWRSIFPWVCGCPGLPCLNRTPVAASVRSKWLGSALMKRLVYSVPLSESADAGMPCGTCPR